MYLMYVKGQGISYHKGILIEKKTDKQTDTT